MRFRLLKGCLIVVGIVLVVACIHQFMISRLDRTTTGTVIGLVRDPASEWKDNNWIVYYQFRVYEKHGQNGTYLLENPMSLGEMPRMGTYMQVSYSTLDPAVNRPWSQEDIDYGQVFAGEFLLVVGVVLLLAGATLR